MIAAYMCQGAIRPRPLDAIGEWEANLGGDMAQAPSLTPGPTSRRTNCEAGDAANSNGMELAKKHSPRMYPVNCMGSVTVICRIDP